MSCNDQNKDADGFTKLGDIKNTLTAKLTRTVDKIRDLHTVFGRRPYVVRIIRSKWSGPKRGRGTEIFVSESCLSPTPLVSDLSSLQEVLTPIGFNEMGAVQVSEISGRYSEEFLLGVDSDGNQLNPNESFFWEIEYPRRDGKPSQKRRFHVQSTPTYSAARFQWSVSLNAVDQDRARNGELR
jgi:hypothetical protein